MIGEIGRGMRVPPHFNETIRRLTLNLKEADRYLVHTTLPESALGELSEAVDRLRATVWSALNSVVDEFSSSQRATWLLTSQRIQRARALLQAIEAEIGAGHITASTPGVDELRNQLGRAYKKLQFLTTPRSAPPQAE